jgi:quercetin dioxygenase-like cupin family protein
MKIRLLGLLTVVGTMFVVAVVTRAEPANGVTPTVLARGTYPRFHVKTDPSSLVDFEAKAKEPLDLVVRQHQYAASALCSTGPCPSSTGWHRHPGPVFITVTHGTLTFYEADDPTCTPHVVSAQAGYDHAYVDEGHGHIGRNESGEPATDVSVIVAPVNLPFRTDIPAPGNCPF